MNEKDIIGLTLGIFFLKILTKIFKKMINQNRPNNKKDGMPSFCGAFTLYIATYIVLNSNLNYKTYFSILVFNNSEQSDDCCIMFWSDWKSSQHCSTLQVYKLKP